MALWLNGQTVIKVSKEKNKEEIKTLVDKPAEFPGGIGEMQKFVNRRLANPALCANDTTYIKCKVFINFVVDSDGVVKDGKIIKGCPVCTDFEVTALKIVSEMPKWSPALLNNKPVKSYYNLPVNITWK